VTTPLNPIDALYARLGGAASYLGAPTSGVLPVVGGTGRKYQHGNIYYSTATGAHAVHGDMLTRYGALHGSGGPLGFPTTEEAFTVGTGGALGAFQNYSGSGGSSLYWTPQHGTAAVLGQIRAHWLALGGAAGLLGFPVTDEGAAAVPGARFNNFQGGEILWSTATGAHEVNGAIWLLWAGLGHERSRLGLPTTDEFAVTGGRQTNFQHGHITWRAATNVATAVYS
jgi:uncharacterized protein with LGFP repeats